MEKPDFEALVKNISTEEWDYDLAIAGTSPSGRFSCGKEDVIELLDHVWNTHVVPLQERLNLEKESNHLLHGAMVSAESRGAKKGREEMESEIKALREEIERLKINQPPFR